MPEDRTLLTLISFSGAYQLPPHALQRIGVRGRSEVNAIARALTEIIATIAVMVRVGAEFR